MVLTMTPRTTLERVATARKLTANGEARRLRQAANLSLADIGNACGIEPATIWKWETGRRRPRTGEALIRYANVLDQLANMAKAG